MLTFEISGAQIDGARDYQEDAFLITHLGSADSEGGSLVIVADGMGGHAAGNVASNMAVQTFNKHVTSNFPNDNFADVLRESVKHANNSISETVRETAALKGMGCTLVAAVMDKNGIRWVSVGDSHLYLIRKNELIKKNADHSYGGFLDRMAAEGTPVDAEAGFSRNMLMSALTGEDIAEIDCPDASVELQAGDRLIAASDGLDSLSQGKILAFSNEASTPKECVDALLQGVEDAKMPRQDNTTVIIIDVSEKDDTVPPAAAVAPDESTEVDNDSRNGAARSPFHVEAEEPKKSSMGLVVGLVAVLVIAIAAGGYWFMDQTGKVSNPPLVDSGNQVLEEEETTEPVEQQEDPEIAIGVDPEPISTDETKSVIEPTTVAVGNVFTDTLKSGGTTPEMIWISGGRMSMGSHESSAEFSERPQHTVTLKNFAMSTHEITIAEFRKFANATGRKRPETGDLDANTYPVFFVSWNDALAYTKWLSAQSGKDYRLPTESEWEYAARGGTTTAYWWGRNLGSDHAHCFACATDLDSRHPTRVARFKPNAFGLFDLAGNVEEWVYDCYHKNYDGAPSDGSVFEGGDCSLRVTRGGAFSSGPKALRSSARSNFRVDRGNDGIGVRIVRDP
ncbi:MAG: formylglycine-generating enzyme required for sulfatase activity/serine [Gammaproteobacteria bacterium]|jgi:formylglycine-generating enzyme required for sulfatase activity/serine/threonine protein phosphatase PrpC